MSVVSMDTREESLLDPTVTPSPPRGKWRGVVIDLAAMAVLAVIAFLVRRQGLPTHGFWLDDAIEGAARKASLSELITVSGDHPGYNAILMGLSKLTGGSDVGLAYPALIAGVVGSGLLYLTLRLLGYARSISFLLGAALVASQTDIVYSGRLKSHTTDVLVVLILVLLVSRLSQIRWRWPTAVLWAVVAILLSTFSFFSLVAVAVAGLVLVIRPASDLGTRGFAIGVQLAANLVLGLAIANSYNTQATEAQWRQTWDGFVTFYLNPLRFGAETLRHLTRIGQVFPGGVGWFAALCMVVAICGLVITAWRGPQLVVGQYLLLLLVVAFVGGVLGKVPFGPSVANPLSTGGRVSLWLVPVTAVGLAAVLQLARRRMPNAAFSRVFDIIVCLGAAVTLGFALEATPLPYPLPGAKDAVSFVDSHLGRNDAVLVAYPAYSFAAESQFTPEFEAHPTWSTGFYPWFKDPRIHVDGLYPADPQQIAADVAHARHVLVYISQPPFNSSESEADTTIGKTLASFGFHSEEYHFQDASVEIWEHRPPATPTSSPSSTGTASSAETTPDDSACVDFETMYSHERATRKIDPNLLKAFVLSGLKATSPTLRHMASELGKATIERNTPGFSAAQKAIRTYCNKPGRRP